MPTTVETAQRPDLQRHSLALPPLPIGGSTSWRVATAQSVRSALEALAAHKFRSAMTMIGIIIGICGVLIINAIGQSQNMAIAAQLAQLGSNLVSISPGFAQTGGVSAGAGSRPTLTASDALAIRDQVAHVLAISPQIGGSEEVINGRLNYATSVLSANAAIESIQSYGIRLGAFFTDEDDAHGVAVAVLGQTVVDHLFPGTSPIGAQVRIRNADFTIVGVLQAKGHNGQSDLDDVVIVPFHTGQQRLFGYGNVASILLQVDRTDNIPAVVAGATKTLEQSHHVAPGRPDDFVVRNFQQIVDSAKQQAAVLTTVLTAVAGVALAIGGFGIMNIMLISITERTQEIGVRIAVGARPSDVLLQFLIEALTLCLVGAMCGILAGYAVATLITHMSSLLTRYPALPTAGAVGAAVGVAILTGLVFGFYPAQRAARLDPIVALRYE